MYPPHQVIQWYLPPCHHHVVVSLVVVAVLNIDVDVVVVVVVVIVIIIVVVVVYVVGSIDDGVDDREHEAEVAKGRHLALVRHFNN
jgi:hypothetical protein